MKKDCKFPLTQDFFDFKTKKNAQKRRYTLPVIMFPPNISRSNIVTKKLTNDDEVFCLKPKIIDCIVCAHIGSGSESSIKMVIHNKTGKIYALKNIILEKKQIKDFLQKYETIVSLEPHSNLVKYYDYNIQKENVDNVDDVDETHEYYDGQILMEYVSNYSIDKLISAIKIIPESLVKKYTKDILYGLQHLHAHNIVHRDIKGSNILITKNGGCKICDYGSFGTFENNSMKTFCGTLNWMSPEIIHGELQDTTSDIWSLGCTVMEMLTGENPFNHLKPKNHSVWWMMILLSKSKSYILPPGLSNEAYDFLHSCLKRDKHCRPNVKELLKHQFLI